MAIKLIIKNARTVYAITIGSNDVLYLIFFLIPKENSLLASLRLPLNILLDDFILREARLFEFLFFIYRCCLLVGGIEIPQADLCPRH